MKASSASDNEYREMTDLRRKNTLSGARRSAHNTIPELKAMGGKICDSPTGGASPALQKLATAKEKTR